MRLHTLRSCKPQPETCLHPRNRTLSPGPCQARAATALGLSIPSSPPTRHAAPYW